MSDNENTLATSALDPDTPLHMLPPLEVKQVLQSMAEVQDYNHSLLNVPVMWKVTRGAGIKCVILDTGRPVHNDLRISGAASFIPGYNQDTNYHSTHVGGIIAAIADNNRGVMGIAPDVEDYYGAVLDGSGVGTVNQIVEGIRWAVDVVQADVVNMSLSIPGKVGDIAAIKNICQYAYDKGVILVAAAGNEGGRIAQPARFPTVIAVAAANNNRQHARFSNSGPELDFSAGGVDVYSCWGPGSQYARSSGTSMAAPALTGAVCLIMSAHKIATGTRMTFGEVYAELRRLAIDAGSAGFDPQFGYGIPFFKKAIPPPPPPPPVPEAPAPAPVPQQPAAPGAPDFDTVCRRIMGGAQIGLSAASTSAESGKTVHQAAADGLRRAADYLDRTNDLGS